MKSKGVVCMSSSRWFERIAAAAVVTAVFSAGEVMGRVARNIDTSCTTGATVGSGGITCPPVTCEGYDETCKKRIVAQYTTASPPTIHSTVACTCADVDGPLAALTCSA